MELRTFKTYTDMQVAHQKDIDNFPMFFSFGSLESMSEEKRKEFEADLAKIGAKSLDECCSVYGCGDILRKIDVPKLKEIWERQDEERKLFDQSYEHLKDRIEYEMNNHEYGYTRDPWDTLAALGKTSKDFEDENFSKAWTEAEREVFEWFDEHC